MCDLICEMSHFYEFLDEEMKPYLQQIDEIDAAVDELQTTVEALDIYTQRLGLC